MTRGSRRAFALASLLALTAAFFGYRWSTRAEPLNSDDAILFQMGTEAARGEHWLFQDETPEIVGHAAYRVGLLPVLAAAISIWGATYTAYVAVSLAMAWLGFVLVWWIVREQIDPTLAVVVALVHLALPFELRDGGLLGVDLPAALFSMAALFFIDRGAASSRRAGQVAWGVAGGLAVAEAYLLRTNSVILLLPALCALAIHRGRRLTASVAAAVAALGFLAEQVVLMSFGFELGHRWVAVGEALEAFGRFQPTYTPGEFVPRVFTDLWSNFGGGAASVFVVAVYLGFLSSLAAMLLRSRSPLLRALAILGLVTYAVFAYGFSSWQDGEIHPLAPTLFRYYQPFYYTGLIALAWVLATLRERLRAVAGARRWLPTAVAAGLGLVLATSAFATSGSWLSRRLDDPESQIRRGLCFLDGFAATREDPPLVLTTEGTVRLFGMFRGPWSDPAMAWRDFPFTEAEPDFEGVDAAFFDWRQLRRQRRYLTPEEKELYDAAFADLTGRLSEEFLLRGETRKYRFYQRLRTEPVPGGGFAPVDAAADTVEGWRSAVPLDLEPAEDGGVVVRLAPGTDRALLFNGGGGGPVHPPPEEERHAFSEPPGTRLAARIDLDLPADASATLFVLQYLDLDRVATDRTRLVSGVNRVPIVPAEGATGHRFAVRLATDPAATEPVDVVLRELTLRFEPLGELCSDDG